MYTNQRLFSIWNKTRCPCSNESAWTVSALLHWHACCSATRRNGRVSINLWIQMFMATFKYYETLLSYPWRHSTLWVCFGYILLWAVSSAQGLRRAFWSLWLLCRNVLPGLWVKHSVVRHISAVAVVSRGLKREKVMLTFKNYLTNYDVEEVG